MQYLLDTNIFIAAMNDRSAEVDRQLVAHRGSIALSSIVLHELCYGAFRSDRVDRNLARIDALDLTILAFDAVDAREAGRIRARLATAGRPIGPLDSLIAGQALARCLTLVTNNMREFSRVDGLALEDWTIPV